MFGLDRILRKSGRIWFLSLLFFAVFSAGAAASASDVYGICSLSNKHRMVVFGEKYDLNVPNWLETNVEITDSANRSKKEYAPNDRGGSIDTPNQRVGRAELQNDPKRAFGEYRLRTKSLIRINGKEYKVNVLER